LQTRNVLKVIEPQTTSDGAGVRLKRSIGTRTLDYLDPFLLFDHFGSDAPEDYIAGFPMHPHRGIETVTYMISGAVDHRDSIGNAGTIEGGDIQWMTAGGGIMHEEMPHRSDGVMEGFQLWVNLPARLKMTTPRYQNVPSDQIPEIETEGAVRTRIIAGTVNGVRGAVSEIAADPSYLDVSMPAGTSFEQPVERGHSVFAYVFDGAARFGTDENQTGHNVPATRLVVFKDGDVVRVETDDKPVRFLLVSGKPLEEPMARYGPFVMNTEEEIYHTIQEIRSGNFPAPVVPDETR